MLVWINTGAVKRFDNIKIYVCCLASTARLKIWFRKHLNKIKTTLLQASEKCRLFLS